MKEAMLYETLADNRVRCLLCAHQCVLAVGKRGICGVRKNVDGILYTLVYGRTVSRNNDPVEKKPLYHFYPGSSTYSIATPGCNFCCHWCQNWTIAQPLSEERLLNKRQTSPEQIMADALLSGSQSIAYTYTEPTVFFEYCYDITRLAHRAGLTNIMVTNGYMSEDMLDVFHPHLDAANVDLKSFRDETYRHYTGARLQPVLDSLKRLRESGVWLEVTTLIIPHLNDDLSELRDIARFIALEISEDTPWHISRFYPSRDMLDRPPTSLATLEKAKEIGQEEGLLYIYIGNVPGQNGANTRCPDCRYVLIQRRGFHVVANHIQDGICPNCGASIAGIGMEGADR